ncbi:MAG TPA: hypothetical protein VGI22_18295 [Xanthobacteraceae bacterium]
MALAAGYDWDSGGSPSRRGNAVPAQERQFSALDGGQRIAAGANLPAPVAVFARYVESDPSAQA